MVGGFFHEIKSVIELNSKSLNSFFEIFCSYTSISLNVPAYMTETDFFVSSEQSSLVFVHLDERFWVYLRLVSLD